LRIAFVVSLHFVGIKWTGLIISLGFLVENNMDQHKLRGVLAEIANEYPISMIQGQLRDVPRIAFHISLVLETGNTKPPSELSICDFGGGIGLFSLGCAAIGFKRVILIDDFNDAVNQQVGDSILSLHRKYGVEVISRNVVARGIRDICMGFDFITTFDSMEHWHHSPKRLFKDVVVGLNPGGVFVLGVPNCVNMRKRITMPLGICKWSSMQDWYEPEVFRGHVREPDVCDLKYIARDMGLVDVRIIGRNWLGYYSERAAIRIATKLMDYPLRLKPSLCSDLYMTGKKPYTMPQTEVPQAARR
jgi:2-polyprenyl-3-methyl-5-hydroxy-6-metoxy-1,4-benzoquinol methylase